MPAPIFDLALERKARQSANVASAIEEISQIETGLRKALCLAELAALQGYDTTEALMEVRAQVSALSHRLGFAEGLANRAKRVQA